MRELDNVIERLLACASDEDLRGLQAPAQADQLLRSLAPELFLRHERVPPWRAEGDAAGAPQSELARIQAVLTACDGDRTEAARRLGISRTTLWRKLKGP